MKSQLTIGVVAPSSVVSQVELSLGLERLKQSGFIVYVHPQVEKKHLFFAGTDEERAEAFYESACDRSFSVLWSARGGYGAYRLLPLLEKMTEKRGKPPKKLLVGFSDTTILHEFVRTHWGWQTLHAPMAGNRTFSVLDASDWQTLVTWVKGQRIDASWENKKLRFLTEAPTDSVSGGTCRRKSFPLDDHDGNSIHAIC